MNDKHKEARKEYIESWIGLVDVVVNSLLKQRKYSTYKNIKDDLISVGYEGLIEAIDKFDKNKKIKPVTFYAVVIRNKVIDYIRKENRLRHSLTYISFIEDKSEEEEEEYNEEWVDFVDKYEPDNDIDKAIYHQNIMGNDSIRELALELNVNPPLIKKRKARLLKKLKKLILEQEDFDYEN